ncbi:hypothetical protein FFLO_05617 [Filobasidium floriforme]|uniref:Uncharacterized protein n=1 Tax=Filobasidium floriforme TaxID=5210 RepID=A0A8K0NNN2_9TREE|nr:hypothetical protein FFLO_05617 [Filobasidium floriforme]
MSPITSINTRKAPAASRSLAATRPVQVTARPVQAAKPPAFDPRLLAQGISYCDTETWNDRDCTLFYQLCTTLHGEVLLKDYVRILSQKLPSGASPVQALEGATFKLGWGSIQFNSLAHGYTLRKATMPYHAKDLAVFKASEEVHMTVMSGYITYFSKHRAKIIEDISKVQAPPRPAPLTFDKAFLSQLWQILRAHLSPEDDAAHGDLVEMTMRYARMHCPDVPRATRLNDGRHVDQINRTCWRPLTERAGAEPPCLRYDQLEFEHTGEVVRTSERLKRLRDGDEAPSPASRRQKDLFASF